MANIDRFFQDLGELKESPVDLSSYAPITEKREFHEVGTVVLLTDNKFGEVTITDRLPMFQGKLYDYQGVFESETGKQKKLYFDENAIAEVKKKEVNVK